MYVVVSTLRSRDVLSHVAMAVRGLSSYWWLFPVIAVTARTVHQLQVVSYSSLAVSEDSALFYHSGLAWVELGRTPYLYTWDIKGPLTHEIAALLALAGDGVPVAINQYGVWLNGLCFVIATVMGVVAVFRLTDSKPAAFVSGSGLLLFPYIWTIMGTGYRPKFPFLAALALCFAALVERRLAFAAVAAAAMAALWQVGALVVLLVFGIIVTETARGRLSPRVQYNALAGVCIVFAVTVAPFVAAGALGQLIVQTVIAPVVSGTGGGGLEFAFRVLDPTLAAVAVLGVAAFAVERRPPEGWLPALLLAVFALVALALGQLGTSDLLPLTLLSCVGAGVGVAAANRPDQPLHHNPAVWIVTIVVVSAWYAPAVEQTVPVLGSVGSNLQHGTIATQCHVRMSTPEMEMIRLTGHSPTANVCWSPSWWPSL